MGAFEFVSNPPFSDIFMQHVLFFSPCQLARGYIWVDPGMQYLGSDSSFLLWFFFLLFSVQKRFTGGTLIRRDLKS